VFDGLREAGLRRSEATAESLTLGTVADILDPGNYGRFHRLPGGAEDTELHPKMAGTAGDKKI
jgi:hypothetical protein